MPILGIMASAMSANLWQPQGAYDALSTVTVGATAVSSVTFAGIPQGYKHLQIRMTSFNTSSIVDMKANFNGDTAANYSIHYLYGTGTAAAASAIANASYASIGITGALYNQGAGVSVVDILDYADTNKYKTTRCLSGLDTNSTTCFITLESGSWRSTAAINSITITPQSGTITQYSQFTLYGIR
jgi:hypothetical protein